MTDIDRAEVLGKLQAQYVGMREQNVLLVQSIERMGGGVEISQAQVEFYFLYLVKLGVMTEEDMWQMKISWEQSLRAQLKDMKDNLNAMRIEEVRVMQQRETVDKVRARIILPPGARRT